MTEGDEFADMDKGLFLIAKADHAIAKLTVSSMQDELSINIAAYHAQQAIEKLMKAMLNLEGVAYPATHNISLLIDVAQEKEVHFPDWLDDITFLLNGWATQTRYNASFVASRRDVTRILALIDNWIQEIERSLGAV